MDADHLHLFIPIEKLDNNLVKINLQAMTLSDLSTGTDGRTICPFLFYGEHPPDFSVSQTWLRQIAPTKSQICIWQKHLSTAFLRTSLFWQSPTGLSIGPPTFCGDNVFQTIHEPSDYANLKAY
jgi:hypothetical protein